MPVETLERFDDLVIYLGPYSYGVLLEPCFSSMNDCSFSKPIRYNKVTFNLKSFKLNTLDKKIKIVLI